MAALWCEYKIRLDTELTKMALLNTHTLIRLQILKKHPKSPIHIKNKLCNGQSSNPVFYGVGTFEMEIPSNLERILITVREIFCKYV